MLCAHCGAELAVEVQACTACGQDPTLLGRYRLSAILGSGGQATTYRGERVSDGAPVAIKELLLRRLNDWKALELFEREAAVLRAIAVDGVPHYLDQLVVGVGKQQGFYLVQELIAGESLEQERVTRRRGEAELAATLAEVADILARLHALRPPVVHRDVKPSNVLRRADGKLMLIDFGSVADALRDQAEGGSTVAGTFGYMAPEQFAGRAEPRSDLYGLGATAIALLSGRAVQEFVGAGNVLEWRSAVVASPALQALLSDLLDPDPQGRPASAEEVARRLRAIAAGETEAPSGQSQVPPSLQGVSLADVIKGKVDVSRLIEGIAEAARGQHRNGPPLELRLPVPETPRPLSLFASRKLDAHAAFNVSFGFTFGGIGVLMGSVLAVAALLGGAPGEMGFVGAGVGLLFGGIGWALFASGLRRWRKARRVWRDGRATVGRLLECRRDRSVKVNGRSPYLVRYSYGVAGATYEGEIGSWSALLASARPGQTLTVLYNEAQPEESLAKLP